MKTTILALGLPLLLAGAAVAQDSTQPKPAPTRPPAAATAASLTVVQAVLTDSVVNRMPADSGTAYPATVGSLVCFTKVSGATAGTTIHHVWFHGDTQVGDVELHVDGSPWRTWSRKTIPADWTGAWHVEVRDAAGTVLKRIDFTVGS
ncbi:MAG TPA: DUF2914 domain-containing protein [Gemmatimonadales bacterium]|nr:DUF2914 domain-containing protein [Gemmatimonadales bacterium]